MPKPPSDLIEAALAVDVSLLPSPAHGETAARHAVAEVPVADEDERAGDIAARLSERRYQALEAVYVVDAGGRFLGAVTLPAVYGAPHEQRMGALANRDYPRVPPGADQEHVAHAAFRRRASSVAVVDDDGRFIGAVPAPVIIGILRREHVEDLHRLAGIQREDKLARSALEAPPLRRARHRIPWLLVGLAGSFACAALLERFERLLHAHLAVAFFVPMVVYLTDAVGTQTEAIVVRGLSLSRLPLRRLLAAELRTGLLIGLILGAAAFPAVTWLFDDVRLGTAVGASIAVAGAVATSVGLVLPWLIQRLGSDPAFGSGPLATIIQDSLSILIYLAIATASLS